jgi:DNA-binding response OmpR family regulator
MALLNEESGEKSSVVLAVDDEPTVRNMLSLGLADEGFQVHTAGSGTEALQAFEAIDPDVVLLDIMMPDISGVDVARQLRGKTTKPIIMLTALGSEQDIINGLDAGADDYVVKPFRLGELSARIRAAVRRAEGLANALADKPGLLRIGDVTLDRDKRELVAKDGSSVNLSAMEYRLLNYLIENKGRLLSHAELAEQLWGPGHDERARYLRVYIRAIRHKLGDTGRKPRFLHSHYSEGYVFDFPA